MHDAALYAHPDVAHVSDAEWAPRRFWVAQVPLELVIDNGTAPASEAVEVYANHGRWIVECPACRGAQLAAREDRRFMCNNCANAAIGSLWRPIVWPKSHAQIGALLDQRPAEHTRNWQPGEKVRDLKADNVTHLGSGA